jgi:hypothetical protein
MVKQIVSTAISIWVGISSIQAQVKSNSGSNYEYPSRCLGVELDGSITVESYGKGRNYQDATEQAKKKAVFDVIFYGIKEGNGGCNSNPLVFAPTPQELYSEFISNFFKDNGKYTEFISLSDERISNKFNRNAKKGNQAQQRMVVVRVDREGLKKYLIENKIN